MIKFQHIRPSSAAERHSYRWNIEHQKRQFMGEEKIKKQIPFFSRERLVFNSSNHKPTCVKACVVAVGAVWNVVVLAVVAVVTELLDSSDSVGAELPGGVGEVSQEEYSLVFEVALSTAHPYQNIPPIQNLRISIGKFEIILFSFCFHISKITSLK